MKDEINDEPGQTPDPPIDKAKSGSNDIPKANVSIQQQFNELRSTYLDERSKSINRWLAFTSIVLVFFTILIPLVTGIAAYFIYVKFGDIQTQMLKHVNQAEQHAINAGKNATESAQYHKKIKQHQAKIQEVVSKLTSKDFSNPNKVETFNSTIQDILKNPELSLEDRAIIEAYKLQRDGKIPDAIEKWRAIANTAMGVNNDLVARSFFSIGYLHSEQNETDKALSAYDEAIILTPNFAEAYINRGSAKRALGNHEEAITDFNEVIRLNPNSASAYTYRGVSKNVLGKHQEAIIDHDEAIRLKPDFFKAYINRGSAKRSMGQMGEARKDFDKGLELAQQQGEEKPDVDVESKH